MKVKLQTKHVIRKSLGHRNKLHTRVKKKRKKGEAKDSYPIPSHPIPEKVFRVQVRV